MKIHFIGIGGIGTSALAQYYIKKGHKVSGSDINSSEITNLISEKGGKVYIGEQKAENINKNLDLVIYSPAISKNNPELKKAKKLNIKTKNYPEALGKLTEKHFTIAVSGTHGKSTTTAMASKILIKANLDPTVIIGTKLKEFNNSNCRVGSSEYLLIEADEYHRSFLNYSPDIIILTNIEKDHLDYYKNLDDIIDAYKKYISKISKSGIVIANKEDSNIRNILKSFNVKREWFSLKEEETFCLKKNLKVPGVHNLYNALAAVKLGKVLKIDKQIILEALSQYSGSWRRFEQNKIQFKKGEITLINDYAHHPTEIEATLIAARGRYENKKIWCVYQPHQHQRTVALYDDFIEIFTKI
ncbi:MAG: UDP-N-acetylmuramate--L-alanine ligase, partial [Minisyncoccales bacterium]